MRWQLYCMLAVSHVNPFVIPELHYLLYMLVQECVKPRVQFAIANDENKM
jgi:hypothetical protein